MLETKAFEAQDMMFLFVGNLWIERLANSLVTIDHHMKKAYMRCFELEM